MSSFITRPTVKRPPASNFLVGDQTGSLFARIGSDRALILVGKGLFFQREGEIVTLKDGTFTPIPVGTIIEIET